jgi:pimeloyl-ACP methyl ester carboxylesterase
MPYTISHGVRIRNEVEGNGPPLILHLVGLGCCLEDWVDAGFVAAVRDDFRVILFDPRGAGPE